MGPEEKALWKVTYKAGYTFGELFFNCKEEDIQFMFKKYLLEYFKQPVELFSYSFLGEVVDYDKYKPVANS